MKNKIFYSILSFFIFSTCFINASKLVFINNIDSKRTVYVKLVGWKTLLKKKVKIVKPGKYVVWSPDIKSNIKQNILKYGFNKNKLDITIILDKHKGYCVPKGYIRKISLETKNTYQLLLFDREGRATSKSFKIGLDLLEKTREVALNVFHRVFALPRKLIKNVKNPLNPVPYKIIHKNPYAKTQAEVRVGGNIACENERNAFKNRQEKVKKAQEEFLNVKFDEEENPLVIAFVGSGGGQRARLCSTGFATGAKKIGLLDCVTYFSALSGSTWMLAPWLLSKMDIEEYRKRALKEAGKDLGLSDLVVDVKHALDILKTKFAFGQSINVIDLFGILLSIEYLVGLGEDSPQRCYLSSIADSIETGERVIPVFSAVTAEMGMGHKRCWFTPWEFGSNLFGKEGAYIPVWAFGRDFKNKKSKNFGSKKKPLYGPRPTLGFLMAIWGSAIAGTAGQAYDQIFAKMKKGPLKTIINYTMKKTDIKKTRLFWGEVFNFMYKLPGYEFSKFRYLKFADAGVKFNLPIFCTYRRPKDGEKIKDGSAPDIIFLLESSANIDNKELRRQSEYAKKNNLPFPEIDYKDLDKKIISIFDKKPEESKFEDYEIPTVIYMPRILKISMLDEYKKNPDFKKIIEKLKGFDLGKCLKKACSTFNFKYSSDAALGASSATEFNMRVSEDKIKEAIRKRLELNRKRDGIVKKEFPVEEEKLPIVEAERIE
ncbi:hypothetical protein KAT08_01720 [Candidatus Babeliales bacterium]|nr:hypothetical protein [Candidatus Babeliales bacterium]